MEETDFFTHLNSSMWLMFGLGVVCVILYSWVTKDNNEGVGRYFKLTLGNVLFHIVGSLIIFLLLEEIGAKILEAYAPAIIDDGAYQGTLSTLSGAFGSTVVANVLNKFKKKQDDAQE